MEMRKLKELRTAVLMAFAVLLSVSMIIESPADSGIIRMFILTVVSLLLFIFESKENNKITKLVFRLYTMALLIANELKITGDIIRGKPVYSGPMIPDANEISVCAFLLGVLFAIGLYFFSYWGSIKSFNLVKKFTKDDHPKISGLGPEIILLMIIFYSLSIIASAIVRPIYDCVLTKQIDYSNLQNYLFLALYNWLISTAPLLFFLMTLDKSLESLEYNEGNFLVTEDKTIIRYKGKSKRIYIPLELKIYCTDTFLECDSSYEIWFEEGITEIPPLKFKKSIPEIHYPSSLQNIREYSVFKKDENPFDNKNTVKMLLNNPVFKVIDGCMVNTKTNTLLFVTDHQKNEIKIPDCVTKIGRYAFSDLELARCYKLKKNSEYKPEDLSDLIRKHQSFSNGTGKEYLLHESETVFSRAQLEKVYLHKNIEFIDEEAFELGTGLREVYVPEDADYDLAEMISTRPYIKYLGKGKKITHRMIERLLQIHAKIKSGCYPNSKQLAYDLETSEPTINRDIEYLRDSRGAPIEYDHLNRGYYYTEDYDLFFDK